MPKMEMCTNFRNAECTKCTKCKSVQNTKCSATSLHPHFQLYKHKVHSVSCTFSIQCTPKSIHCKDVQNAEEQNAACKLLQCCRQFEPNFWGSCRRPLSTLCENAHFVNSVVHSVKCCEQCCAKSAVLCKKYAQSAVLPVFWAAAASALSVPKYVTAPPYYRPNSAIG